MAGGTSDREKALFCGEGLAVMRGERLLFKQLSFALGPGEVLVLRGTNGSGKTTLLRIMAGLTRPLAGTLTWDGLPLKHAIETNRYRATLIGHRAGLKDDLSVAENLAFEAGLLGLSARAVAPAMERLDIARLAELPLRYLSAGQRRRVALTRLALGGGPLWLLDEPATALDSASEAAFWQLCRERLQEGDRLVIASHSEVPLAQHDTVSMDRQAA
ncbi:MAG: heme ABC exporter ATP-binding protein CcmA [Kiloniellales bacterium]